MIPAVGQRWRYQDSTNDYVAQIIDWIEVYQCWKLSIVDTKLGPCTNPIYSKLRDGVGWAWTYLEGQDCLIKDRQ